MLLCKLALVVVFNIILFLFYLTIFYYVACGVMHHNLGCLWIKRWEVYKWKRCPTVLRLDLDGRLQGLQKLYSGYLVIVLVFRTWNLVNMKWVLITAQCRLLIIFFKYPEHVFIWKKDQKWGGGVHHISGKIGYGVHIICYVVGNTAHSKCHPRLDSFFFHVPLMQRQSAV